MVKFQPSFSFWPRPQFLGESRQGLAAWILDREVSRPSNQVDVRRRTIQHIIDNHHDRNGRTIEHSKPANTMFNSSRNAQDGRRGL